MANTFTTFTLSTSESQGVASNIYYPHIKKISNLEQFQKATNYDHCVGRFTDDKRTKTNFVSADCIFLDIDNDSSTQLTDWNDPKMWMTIAKFHELFSGVEHIITPSKSHRKEKGTRASRDRFHIYFPLGHQLTSVEEYEQHIKLLVSLFTRPDGLAWFDTNAVDCARFFFGRKPKQISTPPEHISGKSILEWIAEHPRKDEVMQMHITTSPGSTDTAIVKNREGMKLLWLNGWKYKKLVEGKPIELFYGTLDYGEKGKETDTHWHVRCSSGKHEDRVASLQIDKEGYGWYCYAEHKGGTPFQFMAHRDNEEEGKIIERFCDEFDVIPKSRGILYTDSQVIEPNEPSPEDVAVERLNKAHALITLGGKVRIMKWGYKKQYLSTGAVVSYPELDFYSAQDFLLLYMNDTERIGERNVNVADIWMRHKDRNQYDGIEFDPNNNEEPKKGEAWNIWMDWNTRECGYRRFIDKKIYNSIKNTKQALGMCDTYLNHIQENICGNFIGKDNERALKYILYWMADALVNPTKRSTCIALRSGQGYGKGQFVGKFAELFGNHYVHLHNSDQMTDQFNWHLKDNLLLFADEAIFAGDKKQASDIKGMITDPTRQLRKLYQDPISVPNFTRIIMASNEDWIIPSDMDDRRFFVIDVGGKRAKDRPYFDKMNDEWNSGGREAFCYFLVECIAQQEDFPSYDFENEKITTKAHWEQMLLSNPVVEWYDRILENGYFQYTDDDGNKKRLELAPNKTNYFWQTEEIHKDYVEYMKQQGHKFPFPKNRLSMNLNKMKVSFNNERRKNVEGEGDNKTIWEFASLTILRREWERRTGNDKWSGAKMITNEHAGIIEQMAEENTGDLAAVKGNKLLEGLSKIIVNN